MRRPQMIILPVLSALLFGSATSYAFCATRGAWQRSAYPYSVVSQDVAEVIANFGYNTGLHVSLSQDVKGVVRGHASESTAKQFLDEITRSNDLDWYFDGTVLYVSAAAEEKTAIVGLSGFSYQAIESYLTNADLLDARYRLSHYASGDAAIVSGPPSYVAVIKQAIEAHTANKNQDVESSRSLLVLRGSQSSSMRFP